MNKGMAFSAKRIAVLFATVATVAALGACGSTSGSSASSASSDGVQTINVAGVTGKKPYTYQEDGNYTGYDFELLKKIDAKLPQYEFKYTALEQDALLTGLQSGKYDLASCSFYGTEERFKTFDYSEKPTGLSDARLIIRSDEASSINSLADLAKSGKKLAPIPTDDARYTLISQYNEENPNNKIEFEGATEKSATVADVLKSVAAKKYDAAIYPYTSYEAIKGELNLSLKLTDSIGLFPTVFLYHKGSDTSQLRKDVDKVLQEFRDDGTLSKLSEKWYGEDVFKLKGADKVDSVIYWK